MKGGGVLACLLGSCSLLSCSAQRPVPLPKSQAKPSAELPIGYRQTLQWDVPPAPTGQRNGAQGIAVDQEGRVYVADAEGRRVLVYSSDGLLLRSIEPDARHPKILQRPFGLLFDGHDRLYVTDYDADQVQVFSTEGRFQFAWGREGKGRGQFRAPVAIDQDRAGNLYVVEFYGMRVQKFTHEGKFLLTWGSQAPWGNPAPPEQLLYPSGLAVGPDGNLYLTDAGHDRIKVFSPAGKFLKQWGVKGIRPGDLNAAAGLSFDAKGRLHEADAANHRVQMFTTEGKFLGEWYLPDAAKLKVWSPANLRAVGAQWLYVADVAENKIYKLAIQPQLRSGRQAQRQFSKTGWNARMSWFTKTGSVFDMGPPFPVIDKNLQSSIPGPLHGGRRERQSRYQGRDQRGHRHRGRNEFHGLLGGWT